MKNLLQVLLVFALALVVTIPLHAQQVEVAEKQMMPSYPGGMKALVDYFNKNLLYPEEAKINRIEGQVMIAFTVSKNGNLRDLKVIEGIGGGCIQEAKRVLENSGSWVPGMKDGTPVDAQLVLPINFKLPKE